MQKLKNMKLTVTTLLLITLFALQSFASIQMKVLAVPQVQQIQTKWCWAAASTSVIRYHTGTWLGQASFVETVKGSLINEGATVSEISYGLRQYGFSNTILNSAMPFNSLIAEIEANRPAIAAVAWYSNGTVTGGHALTLRGYDDSGSTKYLSYMEPDDGMYYSMTYNAFTGSTSGTRHWFSTIHNIRK